jgi:hypothetical protein
LLSPETPYPYVGSYALLEDEGRTELVRILWRREGWTMVSFPLRDGASGNKTVASADLIDATPLAFAEQKEFHDLDRALFGRSPSTKRQKALNARRDALHRRMVWAPYMERLMRQLREREALRRAA